MNNSNRALRRFEILLPKRFNDGTMIPRKLIGRTQRELLTNFGAVSFDPSAISGFWVNEGQTYLDALTRLFVDVPDTAQNIAFFREFKETLKARFQQIDIWMVHLRIEMI